MLVEKKMFGHWPFCCRASSSVPGAPASSLATGSHELVLNPGVEICAPAWVAVPLLATFQPPGPRPDRSLAPLADGEPGPRRPTAARALPPGPGLPVCGAACAPDAADTSNAAASVVAAQRARRGRMTEPMAGNSSCGRLAAMLAAPQTSVSSYTFQTNLSRHGKRDSAAEWRQPEAGRADERKGAPGRPTRCLTRHGPLPLAGLFLPFPRGCSMTASGPGNTRAM